MRRFSTPPRRVLGLRLQPCLWWSSRGLSDSLAGPPPLDGNHHVQPVRSSPPQKGGSARVGHALTATVSPPTLHQQGGVQPPRLLLVARTGSALRASPAPVPLTGRGLGHFQVSPGKGFGLG